MWLTTTNPRRVTPRFHSIFDDFSKSFDSGATRSFSPSLDVREDDKSYQVAIEIPGIEKKDIDISVKDNVLTIKGEKKQENSENKDGYTWVERSYGSFHRSIRVPENTIGDAISASLENGVLQVTLPKGDQPEKKQITIN